MLKVQKELEYFKDKFNEQDMLQKMDERVQNLEWFKQEALSLQKQMNKYKNEVGSWRAKCNNLEYDNAFLEKQIVDVRRQNR
jgi:chromosome segregation ATPase